MEVWACASPMMSFCEQVALIQKMNGVIKHVQQDERGESRESSVVMRLLEYNLTNRSHPSARSTHSTRLTPLQVVLAGTSKYETTRLTPHSFTPHYSPSPSTTKIIMVPLQNVKHLNFKVIIS